VEEPPRISMFGDERPFLAANVVRSGLTRLERGRSRFLGFLALTFMMVPLTCEATLNVYVSILPQKHFAERVGGEHVKVSVLVPPGRSPEAYEPTPKQMVRLAEAEIFFRIGVPFEDRWMEKISSLNPRLSIIDLREGLELRPIDGGTRRSGRESAEDDHGHSGKDPHIWMNPLAVARMAVTLRNALSQCDPDHREAYRTTAEGFIHELEELDREIKDRLQHVTARDIYIYHPSLGYFADAYGLRQIAIEQEGHEPGPKTLQELIEKGRARGVRAVFVQMNQNPRNAEAVARALGAQVVLFDAMAEDYSENLRSLARILEDILR